MKPRRLAAKLILSITLVVVAVEGVVSFLNAHMQQRQLLDNMVLGADQLSRSITSATWHAMLVDHREAAYQTMDVIAEKQGIDRIRIFNKEGRVTFSTLEAERDSMVDIRAEACYLCHAVAEPLVRVDVPTRSRIFHGVNGGRTLGIVTPIYNEPACSDADCHAHPREQNVLGVLDVNLSLDDVDEEVAAMRYRMGLVMLLEVSLIALLTVTITRRFVGRPIGHLIASTQAVSNMDLERPVRVEGSAELEELATSFDVMRQRLGTAMAELNQLTRNLEATVQERTVQLTAAQQRLAQSARLTALGQLAATVAHEINNPLSGVLNLAALMRRIITEQGLPGDRIEEVRRYLAQVEAETSRVGRIVTDLLSFSRQARPRGQRAELNAIIASTLAVVGHRIAETGVEVRQDLDPGLPPVRGDAGHLQQVVMNLVVNAIEAMPQGGTLHLRTARRKKRPWAVLEVRDSGSGIAPENLPRIFDPFFTTKEDGKGVGLGLAVVYGLVEAHGGEIEVASAADFGTTFTVTLPLLEGFEETAVIPAGEPA